MTATKIPTIRSAQAPIAVGAAGTLSPVWFGFLVELLAAIADLEARLVVLEKKP